MSNKKQTKVILIPHIDSLDEKDQLGIELTESMTEWSFKLEGTGKYRKNGKESYINLFKALLSSNFDMVLTLKFNQKNRSFSTPDTVFLIIFDSDGKELLRISHEEIDGLKYPNQLHIYSVVDWKTLISKAGINKAIFYWEEANDIQKKVELLNEEIKSLNSKGSKIMKLSLKF